MYAFYELKEFMEAYGIKDRKTLQEVQDEWEDYLLHRSSGNDCTNCEHEKECFFAARGYGDAPQCVWA